MANLQLVPNPTVLVVQAGVFLSAMVVVKKLYVDPFLKLKDKRDAATTGNQDLASELLAKNEADKVTVKERISEASSEALQLISSAKKAATEERDAIVAKASAEAKERIQALSKEIAERLSEERARIPEVVAKLSATVYDRAIQ